MMEKILNCLKDNSAQVRKVIVKILMQIAYHLYGDIP